MKKQLLALTTAVTTLSKIGFNPSAQANHKAIHQTHEEFYDELDLDISLRYAPSYMQVLFRIHDSTFHPNTSSKNEAEWHAKRERWQLKTIWSCQHLEAKATMKGAYYHTSRVCYPNDIDYRSRYIDRVQDRREFDSKALEALFLSYYQLIQ